MASSEPIREICGLAFMARIAAIAMTERAVGNDEASGAADRVLALDALARGASRYAA